MFRFLLVASLTLISCANPSNQTRPFSGAGLEGLVEAVEVSGANCLVVEHAGSVVSEMYWHGFAAGDVQEGFSLTKSVAATLTGVAVTRGRLDVAQPVSDFVPQWRPTASRPVTVEHLLQNVSGREFSFAVDFVRLPFEADDTTALSLGLGQDTEPGVSWVYSNSAVQVLEPVLVAAWDRPVVDSAQSELFDVLGLDSSFQRDRAGNTALFAGLQTNCMDMGRLVRLYLDGGVFRGETVLSDGFVRRALTPVPGLGVGYGYLWWLNGHDGPLSNQTRTFDGLPADAFWAMGACGQFALGVPSLDLVVTVMHPVEDLTVSGLLACQQDVSRVSVDVVGTLFSR